MKRAYELERFIEAQKVAYSKALAEIKMGKKSSHWMWFIFPHSNTLLLVVFTLIGFGTVSYLPAFWALPSAFLTSSAAAAAIGFINCTASIGGFVGPKIFGDLSQRTGSFNTGFVFMIACWIIASLLVLLCPRERVPQSTG